MAMSRPELDGWIAALARLQGAPAKSPRHKRSKSLRQTQKKQPIQRG
ncbi:hypothetical protein [Photorhabdus cinerea]|nr:hypothetical protein [Photorhabdus cinerea]